MSTDQKGPAGGEIFAIAAACGADIDGGEHADYSAGIQGSPPTITFTDRQLEAFARALTPAPSARDADGGVVAWADLPWRAAAGWLRSASGSKIMEVGTHEGCISQRESELIAAAVNSYAAPPPAAARGDVPYDRELIARMLDVCGHPKYTLDAYREQARLLREADNAGVANVGTARVLAAEGVQAGEVERIRAAQDAAIAKVGAEMQAEQRARQLLADGYAANGWGNARQLADSVPAETPTMRAIMAVISQQTSVVHPPGTPMVRSGEFHNTLWKSLPAGTQHHARMLTQSWAVADSTELKNALEAAVLALAQQPEARGVVDEAFLLELRQKFQEINLDDDGEEHLNVSAEGLYLIDAKLAALTEARNVR